MCQIQTHLGIDNMKLQVTSFYPVFLVNIALHYSA